MLKEEWAQVRRIAAEAAQEQLAGAVAEFGKKLEAFEKALADLEKKIAVAETTPEAPKRRSSYKSGFGQE